MLFPFINVYVNIIVLKYSDFKDASLSILRQVTEQKALDINGNPTRTKESVITDLKTSSSRRTLPLSKEVLSELEIHRQWHEAEMKKNH